MQGQTGFKIVVADNLKTFWGLRKCSINYLFVNLIGSLIEWNLRNLRIKIRVNKGWMNSNMRFVQNHTDHFVMVSAGLPAFQLGLLAFWPGTTLANLFWYCFRFKALPKVFLLFYIFATFGVCFLTLPAFARVPCCLPINLMWL